MFDVGADELLVIAVVAILVIGPKDMPAALRTAGRWVGKVRRVSNHFRSGIETMIREAELEEMERKWKEQNERVMAQSPVEEMTAANGGGVDLVAAVPAAPENLLPEEAPPPAAQPDLPPAASAEAAVARTGAAPAGKPAAKKAPAKKAAPKKVAAGKPSGTPEA